MARALGSGVSELRDSRLSFTGVPFEAAFVVEGEIRWTVDVGPSALASTLDEHIGISSFSKGLLQVIDGWHRREDRTRGYALGGRHTDIGDVFKVYPQVFAVATDEATRYFGEHYCRLPAVSFRDQRSFVVGAGIGADDDRLELYLQVDTQRQDAVALALSTCANMDDAKIVMEAFAWLGDVVHGFTLFRPCFGVSYSASAGSGISTPTFYLPAQRLFRSDAAAFDRLCRCPWMASPRMYRAVMDPALLPADRVRYHTLVGIRVEPGGRLTLGIGCVPPDP